MKAIKTEFKLPWTIGVLGITIFLLCLLTYMLYVWIIDMPEIGVFQRILVTSFPLFVTPFIIRIEIPKIKQLAVEDQFLIIKNPILGQTRRFQWSEFDGYQSIVYITRYGPLRELMLISDNKIVHEISENYIKNYPQIKRAITKKLDNLGPVDFNYFRYLKDRVFG